jgi:hypothetical protein
MLHYVRYKEISEAKQFFDEKQEHIQAIVGKDYIPFGKAQCPSLTDYADGVDTMKFLTEL